jgi:hypothetical protein
MDKHALSNSGTEKKTRKVHEYLGNSTGLISITVETHLTHLVS